MVLDPKLRNRVPLYECPFEKEIVNKDDINLVVNCLGTPGC